MKADSICINKPIIHLLVASIGLDIKISNLVQKAEIFSRLDLITYQRWLFISSHENNPHPKNSRPTKILDARDKNPQILKIPNPVG